MSKNGRRRLLGDDGFQSVVHTLTNIILCYKEIFVRTNGIDFII